MSGMELSFQNVEDRRCQILGCRHKLGELGPGIQVLMIEALQDLALEALIKINQITNHSGTLAHLPTYGNFHGIVVTVSVRVITFAECQAVLRLGELIAVQAM